VRALLFNAAPELNTHPGPISVPPGRDSRCRVADRWNEVVIVDLGVSVRVRSNDPELLQDVLSFPLPDCRLQFRGRPEYSYDVHALAAGGYELSAGNRPLGAVRARPDAVMCLLSHLHWKLAQESLSGTFIHAGCVAWKGRAIVLPGRSFAGKTSLVVELLRRGATYLSDEYAVIDSSGGVQPFARQLHVRSADGRTRRMLPASLFTTESGASSVPAGIVLFATYSRAARWRPRRMTPGHALLGLLDNTVCVTRAPREVLGALAQLALTVPAFAVERGEARRVGGRILELSETYADDYRSA
jgi:hypothetical protein